MMSEAQPVRLSIQADAAPAAVDGARTVRAKGRAFRSGWARWLLLGLILLAFGRVLWRLDAKNLWWDESLSLQRAESDWLTLLRGHLIMRDGFTEMQTTDQHPFAFFALLGLLVRTAGESEFVLRFPSALSVTLLVVVVWALGRRLAVMGAVPEGTALWAALFAAIHPFFLWYGQEARPYAMLASLALLSTYLLLRLLDHAQPTWAWLVGYVLSLILFLATHYFAVFLLPLHALLLYGWLAQRNRTVALLVAAGVVVVGSLGGLVAAWIVMSEASGGSNFQRIPLRILLPDLINAFGMGLSVDISRVWWLDVLIGLAALAGALWGLAGWVRNWKTGGWILPAFVVGPVVGVMLAALIQPAYMNARHLSLIGGAYILLVGAGLALLGRVQRFVPIPLMLLIIGGASYSSYNYFTLPEYGKDDYRSAGEYLARHIMPGDLLLLNPPFSRRIFEYYMPVAELERAAKEGMGTGVYGAPALFATWEKMHASLDRLHPHYRRIWMVKSGTFPLMDPDKHVEEWLAKKTVQIKVEKFYSPTSFLDVSLYLPIVPVLDSLPEKVQRVDGVFGDQIRLVGVDVGQRLSPHSAMPVTLYWQTLQPTEHHYKYILRLVEQQPDGQATVLGMTEREPYDGVIPTIYWKPDEIIMEYSEIPPVGPLAGPPERYRLTLQIYRADTLEKLPITESNGAVVEEDGQTLHLPYALDLGQAQAVR